MKILLFLVGAVIGSAVVHMLNVPVWLAGPVMGVYIWWTMADDAERAGW